MEIFNEGNFETAVEKSPVPVVVDFFATWCGPCKMVAPILEELSKEYSGKVKFGKVDIDESPGLASKFKIRGVPTMLMFKGGQPVENLVGAQPRARIDELVQKLL